MLRWLLLLILIVPANGFSAAYVPGKNRGMAIIGATSYEARSEFRSNKSVSAFGENGKFTKRELYYYIAVGLNDSWALTASGALLNTLTFENDFDEKTFTGSGDQYVAGRYFLTKDSTGAKAIQLGVSFPVYSRSANPAPGNRQGDLEARYLQDHFNVWGPSFFSWEIGYRFRSSSPSDQLRADLTFGKSLGRWLLMIHGNAIKGLRNESGMSNSVNPNTFSDFDLFKIGASAAYNVTQRDSIQLGLMEDVAGRNTGKGRGLFTSWWRSF